MVEKDIEEQVITALNNLHIDGLSVTGMWQPTAIDIVKGTEDSVSKAGLMVNVPPMMFDTYGFCEVTLNVNMTLVIRVEKDTNGGYLLEVVKPISDLLQKWNLCERKELTDFVTTEFYPGAINVSGGTGPTFDSRNRSFTVTWNLTLRGILNHE